MIDSFSKYAWVPYFVLCMGLVMLFGTEEWMLLNKFNQKADFVQTEADFDQRSKYFFD